MINQLRDIASRDCFVCCNKIVVEFPATFWNPKFSSSALTPVAGISGACITLFQNEDRNKIIPAYPSTWNGCKKKEKTARIIQEILGDVTEWEFDDIPKNEKDFEHAIDAIGMAYWLTERDYFEREAT